MKRMILAAACVFAAVPCFADTVELRPFCSPKLSANGAVEIFQNGQDVWVSSLGGNQLSAEVDCTRGETGTLTINQISQNPEASYNCISVGHGDLEDGRCIRSVFARIALKDAAECTRFANLAKYSGGAYPVAARIRIEDGSLEFFGYVPYKDHEPYCR